MRLARADKQLINDALSTTHPLVGGLEGLKEDEEKTLSRYCRQIEEAADFDAILGGLDVQYNEILNPPHQASKGQLIDSILDSGLSKSVRAGRYRSPSISI
jgi:hypothetical protein